MHSIATCPQCAAQLALPPAASPSDYAVCPECNAEFPLAEADQRWLATAKLVPPPEVVEPEPPEFETGTLAEEETAEQEVQTDISSRQTIELTEPMSFPTTDEAEAEVTELAEPEASKTDEPEELALDDLTPDPRSAETLVSTSALCDWEERLRNAIDTPADTEDETKAEHASASRERTPLEDAPEFDFHMDPPAEKPHGPEEVPTEELTKTAEWFQNASAVYAEPLEPETVEPEASAVQEHVALEPDPVATVSTPQPLKKRRQKNSLLRLAAVFSFFGLLGLVVGQYALLWLRGPSADYMGLVSVVPRSMLPSPTSQVFAPQITPEQTLASHQPEAEPDELETDSNELLTVDSLPTQSEDDKVIEDNSVIAASADLPVADNQQPVALLPPMGTTSAEFSELVDAARQSLPGFLQGDLDTSQSKGRKGHAYMAFCRLAERFDFANSARVSAADANLIDAATSVFRTIAADGAAGGDLTFIAEKWWAYDKRPSPGIVLLGTIESVQPQQGYNVYLLSPTGSPPGQTIPVAISGSEYSLGDSIGVVGTIVPDPGLSLPAFSLNLPQVVVSHYAFDLSQ